MILVTFIGGNDATAPDGEAEVIWQIKLDNVPRIGDAVQFSVQHTADRAIYRVRDVMYVIEPSERKAFVAIEP